MLLILVYYWEVRKIINLILKVQNKDRKSLFNILHMVVQYRQEHPSRVVILVLCFSS